MPSVVESVSGVRVSTSSSLIFRKAQVFYTAAVLFADYKLCQWRCNQLPINDEEGVNAIWSATHKRNSRFLLSTFLGLEGYVEGCARPSFGLTLTVSSCLTADCG